MRALAERYAGALVDVALENKQADQVTRFLRNPRRTAYLAVEFGGFPHERGIVDTLWDRSAIRYANKVKTPTMFVHGENDNDVPIAEAEQFYIALKDVGVETIMIRYPREGHGISEEKHQLDLLDRMLNWFDASLK